jgi:hypothetical protein
MHCRTWLAGASPHLLFRTLREQWRRDGTIAAFMIGCDMTGIAAQIWDMKYRFKAADGTPIDQDVAQSWARVALALASAEKPEQRGRRAQEFAAALAGHKFLPAGRILAGAGTGRAVTLFNHRGFDGRHFFRPARSGADAAAGRRHRL